MTDAQKREGARQFYYKWKGVGQENQAVMAAYGLSIKDTSEGDCVAHLMRMYEELTGK